MKQLFSTKALLLVGTLLLMAACTAVLQRGHSDKRQTKSVSMPLDSLILKKEDNGYGYTTIYFDTTKLKYFPDLDPISLVTLPKYKALFGLTDDYSLVKDSVEQIGRKRIAYKNIPYRGSSYSYDAIDNKLIRAKVCKFTPKYEPTDIKISMDSAIQIILKEDYPSRKQYYKKRLLDSLGYIPERFVKLLHEEPLPSYTLDRLRSDAKFMWDTKISLEKAAFLKYIEADLAYTEALTEVTPLRYTFVVHTLRETWIVYVDAITGQLYKMRDDHYFTCEPNIPLAAYELDHLWYYNFTNQKIDLSTCQYGNNATCQVLRLSNNKLNAFCKNGTFDNNSPGYVPTKNFIDWSVSPDFIPATINLNIVQLPTAINNPDGNVVVSLNPANPLGSNAYTYTATQILSDNGFVATTIGNTTNNGAITTISSGIYELTITDDQNCAYTDYIAIGSQGGFTVTATTTNPNCYRNAGDIHLSIGSANSFGGQNPQIAIKGPFSTNGFVTVPVLSINNDVFNLSISQFNDINTSNDNLPLPPGNYAILVKNPSNNKIGYVNVRLNYPDCETERKILQTAFWAIDRTHKYFRGETLIPITNTIGSNSFNIALPTTIIPTGYTQFANSATAIAIGLVDGPQTNAKFETTSINSSEFRFVISKGTNTNSPCVPLDVMAHEYAHGINALGNQVSGNPDVFSEAEAINEGFSDIMGCIVEATSEATVDWIAGDAMDDGAYATKRNLADPNSQGLPSIYGSELYNNPDLNLEFTFGLNYIRSMIFSHWFYLLTEGGSQTIGNTNYTVSGIGMEKAAKITLAAFVSSAFGLDELSNKNYAGLCK
ncbi:MAG TPA: M4 family metallopeptidase, partial [Chitinophagales bacterium]|nr:M4 family metallopeptidase [Chitinophagales bacterium]